MVTTVEQLDREKAVAHLRRMRLEREIGRTFAQQQKERDPAERTRLWNRCLELVAELERMNKLDN